jgi:hypothetical protein
MKTVKLISVGSAFEANLIKGALENEGISCILHNETSNQVMKGYIQVDVDIFVNESDYDRAMEIAVKAQPKEKAKSVSKIEIIIGIILLVIIGIVALLLNSDYLGL